MKKIVFLLLVVFMAISSFSQIKISQMPAHSGDAKNAYAPIVEGGQNKKATGAQLAGWRGDTLPINKIRAIEKNEPEYEIVVFPDIQNMVRWSWNYGRPMYTWLRDSAAFYNVKAMVQVGDITDWNTQAEWDTVAAWNNYLPTNFPVLYVPGNHDYGTGFNPSGRDATRYKTEIHNFNSSRTGGITYGYYNSSPENSYMAFNAGSKKYFVLGLEFIPRDAVVTWAGNVLDSLLAADPDREVIVVTHSYIDEKGERAKDTSDYSAAHYGMSADNDGQELWDKLIRKKKNIRWVFSGHHLIYNVDANKGLTQRIVSVGDHGNLINQIFVNYQDDVFWGDGYMLRLRFKPSKGTVEARFYSAYYNADDPRVESYLLEDPAVNIASSVGVKTDLSVGRDARIAGKLKVETLFPNRMVFSDSDGFVMGDPGFQIDKFQRRIKVPGIEINYPYSWLSYNADKKFISFKDSTEEIGYLKMFRVPKATYPGFHTNLMLGDSIGTPYGWNNTLIGTLILRSSPFAGTGSVDGNAVVGNDIAKAFTSTSGYNFQSNAIIGKNILPLATGGHVRWNTIAGQNVLSNATSADDMSLFGQNVGNSILSGVKVSAVGSSAFSGLATPVPISYSSGFGGNNFYNTASSYSIGIGYATGRNSSGDSAVLLGNRAGDGWPSIRQKLAISNSETQNPLIYGEFDNGLVRVNGNLNVTGKLTVDFGANKSIGTATLSNGTVTVNTTAVTASSIIYVVHNTISGTQGILSVPAGSITAGTSFIINSSNAGDNSTVNWWIIN